MWRTDGTTAGTFTVTSGTINDLTNLNGVLYFRKFESFKQKLWKSDGTVSGTVAISGLDNIGSGTDIISAMGNDLYLGGKDSYDFEPHKSDGTAAGTVLLKDIKAGSGSSGTMYFTKVNNTMTFVANDSTYGKQIWKTDGTSGGTVMAYSAADTLTNNAPVVRFALNNYLIFIYDVGNDDMYSLLVSSGGTGINDAVNTSDLKIYPNPSPGKFTVSARINFNSIRQMDESIFWQIEIYNILGEKVYQLDGISDNQIIDLSNHPKGIYFVQVNDGEKIYSSKIIIE